MPDKHSFFLTAPLLW